MGEHISDGPLDVIRMENDRARRIREYVVFDSQILNTSILRPDIEVALFELKPMMFHKLQAIGQFGGTSTKYSHLHLKKFVEVANDFKIVGVPDDCLKLRMFPYSLKDITKA